MTAGTGCSERQRLAAEIAKLKSERTRMDTSVAEAHLQSREAAEELAALKGHPALKGRPEEFDERLQKLEAEAAALTQHKKNLQEDIATLEKDLSTYRTSQKQS